MYTFSLPPTPAPARIQTDAAAIANEILTKLTWNERAPIEAYGRCLLDEVTPSTRQTIVFWAALHRFAPYRPVSARLSTDLAALRALQDEIARQVVKGADS